mgnify:CR=1 FL=1
MNKVILMGRLTRDPEVRYTQTNNTLVASFSLAVNRRFTKPGEERQADFINIVAWSKLGEFCSKYFKKGQQVGIIGRIQTRTWDDDKGQKHYITEVIVEETYFADSRRDGAAADMDSSFGADFADSKRDGETAGSFDATFGAMPSANPNSDFEISSGDDLPF